MRLKTFKILLSIIFFIALGHFYYHFTGNFRSEYILEAGPHSLSTALPKLNRIDEEKSARLLKQPFHYAGHGHQTYVFIGDDGKTVLKLFMKEYIRSDWLRDFLPPVPPFRQWMLHRGENHQFRRKRLLNGYANCYALDKENCGLLYFHVDQSPPVSSLLVIDGLGMRHLLPADRVVFALQKKAVAAKEVLHGCLSRGDVEGARAVVDKILDLYRDQYEKGLVDRDRNFLKNTGFINRRPIRMDAGKVVLNDGSYSLEHEYEKIINKRLSFWINKYYPYANFILN